MEKIVFLVLLMMSAGAVLGQRNRLPRYRGREAAQSQSLAAGGEECGKCRPERCDRPQGCVAGVVKDSCDCCDVCGKAEYELCDHPSVTDRPGMALGRCGDNLDCRLRDDLGEEADSEAICYCRIEGTLCGSDGLSYDNLCQLMASGVRSKEKITIQGTGPCNEPATIISKPDNVKNRTGDDVAIVCEARGFPIPTVEWTWTRVDGKTVYLPSDDLHVSVNMRGGPERWQVTGWLQIMDLQREHEGDYTCLAQNKNGMDEATARINVSDGDKTQKKRRKN